MPGQLKRTKLYENRTGVVMDDEIIGTLTEFEVTETYVIKARTREEAYQMVADNDFKYGIQRHQVKIEPNY
jgi:hypothetical protein